MQGLCMWGNTNMQVLTDLQRIYLGGSIKQTLWQPHQLVVVEQPGELREKQRVFGCALHLFTKTKQGGMWRITTTPIKHTGP